jgi:hypothetical protein
VLEKWSDGRSVSAEAQHLRQTVGGRTAAHLARPPAPDRLVAEISSMCPGYSVAPQYEPETEITSMPAPILAFGIGCIMLIAQATTVRAQIPDAIRASAGEAPMLTIHAEGAQIYECKVDSTSKLAWQFREPVAALMIEGKTVGRHYAGPNWELADGSAVSGKVIGRAPGATAKDIAWLRLEVTSQRGAGQLTGASHIQRINTKGGMVEGACDQSGAFLSVPYSADYVFLRKGG